MDLSTITGKGQTTIPLRIREHLNIDTGDKVRYTIASDGKVMVQAAKGSIKDLKRRVPPARVKLSDEEVVQKKIALKKKAYLSRDRD